MLTQRRKDAKTQNFLQSAMWGEFKSRFGWETYYIEQSNILILSRKLLPGFSFAYVPWGPEAECSMEELSELTRELKPFLPKTTVFIRYDLPWRMKKEIFTQRHSLLANSGTAIKKAPVDVQAPDTVVIDLTNSCEEILANMKPKWRYNISLAAKKGVQVNVQCTIHNAKLENFYKLLKETAERDGIAIHSFNYYKTLFELCEKDSKCELRLYTATHEEDTLAAIIVLFYNKCATYLYGASSNNKRNLMAPYALQWKAMQDARELGCEYYDLFGIPPNEDPNHPMAGLYRFKTGFGGEIVHRPGCWDYAYKPILYFIFTIAEKLRKKYLIR